MSSFQNWYEMLGVAQDATPDQIDEAIKARILAGNTTKLRTPEWIAEMVLTHEDERATYDLVLKEGETFARKYHEYSYVRYAEEDDLEKEFSLLNELIRDASSTIPSLYEERGLWLEGKGEFRAALNDIEEVLKYEHYDSNILLAQARCIAQLDGLEKGKPFFEKLLGNEDVGYHAAIGFGTLLIESGDEEAALRYWDEKINEAGEDGLLLRGMLLHEKLLYWGRRKERDKSRAAQEELFGLFENKMGHPEYLLLLVAVKDWAEGHGAQEMVKECDAYIERNMFVSGDVEENLRKRIADDPANYPMLRNYARDAWRHGFAEKSFALLEGEMQVRQENLTQWIEFAGMRAILAQLDEDFDTSKKLFEEISSRVTRAEDKSVAYDAIQKLSDELQSAEMCDMADWFRSLSKEVQPAQKSEGCFIATAVYGDYDHPQVLKLRRFRDLTLRSTRAGRLFIRLYYRFSPFWAEKLRGTVLAKVLVRRVLDFFVGK